MLHSRQVTKLQRKAKEKRKEKKKERVKEKRGGKVRRDIFRAYVVMGSSALRVCIWK